MGRPPGLSQGQTQVFSLFYTMEAQFVPVCPWERPSQSLGQTRGRRAAEKVYVFKFMCLFCSLSAYPVSLPINVEYGILEITLASLFSSMVEVMNYGNYSAKPKGGRQVGDGKKKTSQQFATNVTTPRRSNSSQWTVFASRRQGFTPTLRLVQNPVNGRQTP